MITVMTIAGADPSCGAGAAADIKTLCALDVNPVSVITCITAQNDIKFYGNVILDCKTLDDQIESITDYYIVAAVKIGMIFSRDNIKTVASAITRHNLKNIVLDPVITSSTNASLIDNDAVSHLKSELFPHVDLLTPNLAETEIFTGKSITKIEDMKEAAFELSSYGCKNIVITGFKNEKHNIDLLYDGAEFFELKKDILSPKDKNGNVHELHGTGCMFSSAATAFIAKGKSIKDSVKEAKEFTYFAIKYANKIGDDKLVLNPFFMGMMPNSI